MVATVGEAVVAAELSGPRNEVRGGCLVCGAALPEPFLDLGRTGLANNLAPSAGALAPDPVHRLRVGFCAACSHVQLLDPAPPRSMFDEYLYVSSASSTLSAHLEGLARLLQARAQLTSRDLAVDIGSNDGTLLAAIAATGHPGPRIVGIDPAANLAALALARGVPVETAYFDAATAAALVERHGRARLITATNSLPHIPALDSYLRGVKTLLAPGGMFVVEAHYLGDLVEQNAFDTIYHEHVSYWALGPLTRLLARHSLEVFDVERLAVHHGQLRAWIGRSGERAVSPAVGRLAGEEIRSGLGRLETFTAFGERTRALRQQLRATIAGLRAQGLRVAGYGAPAKASTLLAYCGFGPDDIAWIADRNRLKQGRATPGTRIPIVDPERIAAERPDVLVLFAWNFAGEIMAQLDDFRRAGGRFLVPIPEARLI